MNNNDKIEFNGQNLTIAEIYKKPDKEILVNLCWKVHNLNEKIKNIPEKVSNNSKAVAYIKGILVVLCAVIMGRGLRLW